MTGRRDLYYGYNGLNDAQNGYDNGLNITMDRRDLWMGRTALMMAITDFVIGRAVSMMVRTDTMMGRTA